MAYLVDFDKVQLKFSVSYRHLPPSPSSTSITPTITPFPDFTWPRNSVVAPEIFNRTRPPLALKNQKERKANTCPLSHMVCTLQTCFLRCRKTLEKENITLTAKLMHYLAAQNVIWKKKLFPSNIQSKCQKCIVNNFRADHRDVTSHSEIWIFKLWLSLSLLFFCRPS